MQPLCLLMLVLLLWLMLLFWLCSVPSLAVFPDFVVGLHIDLSSRQQGGDDRIYSSTLKKALEAFLRYRLLLCIVSPLVLLDLVVSPSPVSSLSTSLLTSVSPSLFVFFCFVLLLCYLSLFLTLFHTNSFLYLRVG